MRQASFLGMVNRRHTRANNSLEYVRRFVVSSQAAVLVSYGTHGFFQRRQLAGGTQLPAEQVNSAVESVISTARVGIKNACGRVIAAGMEFPRFGGPNFSAQPSGGNPIGGGLLSAHQLSDGAVYVES